MTKATEQINYIVTPSRVEEIDDQGETIYEEATDLYGDLVLAGYPLTNDTSLGGYYLDIAVRGDKVVAFTSNPGVEWDMGPAGELFLSWMRSA
jgi:hypothetical protein